MLRRCWLICGMNPGAINWTAIGSTATVNARVNTATRSTDPSVPIYKLDGDQFETGNIRLWDTNEYRLSYGLNITEKGDEIIKSFLKFSSIRVDGDGTTTVMLRVFSTVMLRQ